jgi:diguanylate cyclase
MRPHPGELVRRVSRKIGVMAVSFRSLHAKLLVPFALLVLAAAAGVFWSAYEGAQRAVRDVSTHLLEDVANRIALVTSQHMSSASVVLNAAVPDAAVGMDEATEMASITPNAISPMEKRLWLATALYPDKHHYVYYATETGRFIGVHRKAAEGAEVRLRVRANEPRRVYRATHQDRRGALLRQEAYDPHQRPWYRAAVERRVLTWSPIYRDFTTGEPTVTLAKPALRPDGSVLGVAATDMSLAQLVAFVRTLRISENGVAFIVEPDGALVASSVEADSAQDTRTNDAAKRLRAEASGNALVRDAYAAIATAVAPSASGPQRNDVRHASFSSELGTAHLSVIPYRDGAGLDWRLVVAVPQSDHLGSLYSNMARSFAIAAVAVAFALILGFWPLRRVANDVRSVSRAAEKLVSGAGPITRIPVREDEIGSLAHSMAAIQGALLYDQLTGALNRDAFTRQFAATVSQLPPHETVALIFIDLDRFKRVNDRFGHAVGDSVLAKSAERIRRRLRDNDLIARFGGDEFVVMIHGNHAVQSIDALVDRLRERLRSGMTIEGNSVAVGASIGIAVYPDDGETLDELMRVADERMYGEKRRSAVVRELREKENR